MIAQRDPAGGDPRGVGAALARELARHIGAKVRFVTYETAGKLADAAKRQEWDLAFLAIDPERAADIEFSPSYVHIEGTYMVRADSPLRAIEDVDHDGVRVAVGVKSAYDLYLTRHMKHAELRASRTRRTRSGISSTTGSRSRPECASRSTRRQGSMAACA